METSTSLSLAMILLLMPGCYFGINDEDIRNISVEQLRDRLESDPASTVLVDARAADEYQAGHLPGALSRPLPAVTRFDRPLADADMIVVYPTGKREFTPRP